MKRFVLFFIVLLVMVPVFASDAISLSDYLASSEYSWFLTGKTGLYRKVWDLNL